MRVVIPLLLLLSLLQFNASASYEITDSYRRAWMLLMDLRIEQARTLIAEELKNDPENYYGYYLEQTCDAFRMVVNGDDKDYKAFVAGFQQRRKIMDGKDISSPYYLTCLSEMELHVAVFSVMHGAQMSGVNKGVAAYRNLHKNIGRFRDFNPNNRLDGFFNVAIANLPPFVKWALSIMAVDADIDKGFRMLKSCYEQQRIIPGLNAEAALYIILAAKINKTPEMLYGFTATLDSSVSRTFVHRYFRANIAYWSQKNDEALAILRETPIGNNPYTEVIYNYMMGKILLRKLDPGAETYLKRFLALTRKKEYLKEINYYLAIISLLKGDHSRYQSYCGIVKTVGMDLNERDREAMYDASLDYLPDPNLLMARLSLDGGYAYAYRKAMTEFEKKHAPVHAYDLEYHLLKGRFAEYDGNKSLAMAEYRKVIELGESSDYYFASEAAWRLGYLSQEAGQMLMAEQYYRKSLRLYKSDYYEYIGEMAAKALKSITKK